MADNDLAREQQLGLNRTYLTPAERFRGANFAQGTVVSGGVSGTVASLNLFQVSSPVRVRLQNLQAYNLDEGTGWVLVELRDGTSIAGGTPIAGPIKLYSEVRMSETDLIGRYAVSGIVVVVMSGANANPVSNGIKVKVSYYSEPLDMPGERTT